MSAPTRSGRATVQPVSKTKPSAMGGRYAYREICLNIGRMTAKSGLLAKQIAAEVGLSEAAWSKKMSANQSTFSLDELGRIADAFSRLTGRKLLGWPFIHEDLSDQLDRR